MKYIIALIALLALSALGQTVEVKSPTEVVIDGQPAGKVADVIANNRAIAPAVQRALEKWDADRAKVLADKQAAADAAKADATASAARVKTAVDDLATEAESGFGPVAKAKLAKVQAEAAKDRKAAERERLQEQKAAIQAQLDALK